MAALWCFSCPLLSTCTQCHTQKPVFRNSHNAAITKQTRLRHLADAAAPPHVLLLFLRPPRIVGSARYRPLLCDNGVCHAFAASEQEVREATALNYGSIAFIDTAIGRVMAQLQRLGLDDNTVVLMTSDHGELLGDRGLMFKGGLHYTSMTRVPLIWRDTAGARQGALAARAALRRGVR
jgi:arylsulfatase A-like enzyme